MREGSTPAPELNAYVQQATRQVFASFEICASRSRNTLVRSLTQRGPAYRGKAAPDAKGQTHTTTAETLYSELTYKIR